MLADASSLVIDHDRISREIVDICKLGYMGISAPLHGVEQGDVDRCDVQ